jgi:hypothetical protein
MGTGSACNTSKQREDNRPCTRDTGIVFLLACLSVIGWVLALSWLCNARAVIRPPGLSWLDTSSNSDNPYSPKTARCDSFEAGT